MFVCIYVGFRAAFCGIQMHSAPRATTARGFHVKWRVSAGGAPGMFWTFEVDSGSGGGVKGFSR